MTATKPTQNVCLENFTVGSFPSGNSTSDATPLKVADGSGNVLVDYAATTPYPVPGNIAALLSPNVSAHSLVINYGTNWNNGINYINFHTVPTTVPVPGALWLLGSGLIALLRFKQKSKMKEYLRRLDETQWNPG